MMEWEKLLSKYLLSIGKVYVMNRIQAKKCIEKLKKENEQWIKDTKRVSMDGIFNILKRVRVEKKKDFILELIQNADDCHSSTIAFDINPSKIIVQNNGEPFRSNEDGTKGDIFAICKIGKSAKGSGKIGFMGFGFKSVFEVSNKPEIYSGQFSFYLDENMIIPHWIERIPQDLKKRLEGMQGKGAIFVLPFVNKGTGSDVVKTIKRLSPELPLYLQNLRQIKSGQHIIKVEKANIPNSFWVSTGAAGEKYLWKRYSKKIQIPKKLQEFLIIDRNLEKIVKLAKTHEQITITFEITPEEKIIERSDSQLYAFLPLGDETNTKFCFNIQADFSVDASRRKLREADSQWNQWLLANVYKCIIEVINDFKKRKNMRTEFYKALPLDSPDRPKYLEIVKEKIDEALQEKNSILVKTLKSNKYSDGKRWVKPENAILVKKELERLFDKKDIEHLFGKRKFIVDEDEIGNEGMKYVRELVKDELSFNNVFKLLADTQWILKRKIKQRKHPEEWLGNLLIYFANELESALDPKYRWDTGYQYEKDNFFNKLKKLKILLDEDNRLYEPEKLFLPSSEGLKIRSLLPKKYKIISSRLIKYLEGKRIKSESEKDRRGKGRNLLEDLILELSPEAICKEIINPVFDGENWKRYPDTTLMKYTEFILKYENCWQLAKIKLKVQTEKKKPIYKSPNELYLSKKYGNEFHLDRLFRGHNLEILISDDYFRKILKSSKAKNRTHLRHLKKFFLSLGTKVYPKIIETTWEVTEEEIRDEIIKYGNQGKAQYSNWGYRKKDYNLSRFVLEIIEKCLSDEIENSLQRLKEIIKIIDLNWPHYKSYLESEYLYHTPHAQSWTNERLGESSFAKFLRNSNWIPTKDGKHLKPSAVALKELEGKVKIPIVDYKITDDDFKEHLKSLDIQTKPSLDGIMVSLISLVEQNSKQTKEFIQIYEYLARYKKERKRIRERLEESPFIFIPKKGKKYWRISEVFWESRDSFLEWKTALKRKYPNLKDFFLEILGIKEKPDSWDYLNFLSSYLWKREKLTTKEKDCLGNVYHHLSYIATTSGMKENEQWQNLKSEFKAWCENNRWERDREEIYYNDNEELHKLFKKKSDILFAYIPKNIDFFDIKKLFYALGIKGLKEAYSEKCTVQGMASPADENYQNAIRRTSKYITLFVKKKSPEAFERLKKEKKFKLLQEISLAFVEKINVDAVINGHVVNLGERKSYYSCRDFENILFLSKNIKEKNLSYLEFIGAALEDALVKRIGLEFFIPRILEKDESEIEQIMINHRIVTKKDLILEEKKEENKGVEVKETVEFIESQKKRPIKTQFQATQSHHAIIDSKADLRWQPECTPEEAEIRQVDSIQPLPKKQKRLDEKTRKRAHPSTYSKEKIMKGELSPETKTEIGKWGEKLVFGFLRKEFIKKYPKGKIKKTDFGFAVILNKQDIAEVQWLNITIDQVVGYDIKVLENNEENYIEVKSTKTDDKEYFDISKRQWEFAKEKGERFHIYRIHNAGSRQNARITMIPNPVQQWEEGSLNAYPIRIEI